MVKVLFINPPTMGNEYIGTDNYFPLGLLYCATVAKANGMDVKIVDINNYYYPNIYDVTDVLLQKYIEDRLYTSIEQYAPDVMGIGAIFSGAFRGLRIITEKTKEKFPDIPIVIGGIVATMFPEEILKNYLFIDCVVIGEGESTFVQLVNCLFNIGYAYDHIDGIAFRQDGNIVVSPKTKFEQDLDSMPTVDYGILNLEEYKMDTSEWYSPKKIRVGQAFPIISSRSCSQQCNFCNMKLVHGPKIRFRSPTNVLDEMEYLYNEHGVRYFQFMDDNLTFDKKRILAICNGILERNMDIQFDTPNGVSIKKLDQEIIAALVAAGMVRISLAIESGSGYIRNKVIGKGLTNKKIYEVVNECAKYSHLWTKGFFVIGMPQETHETLEDTYKMITELPLNDFGIFFATPYKGTKLFDYCVQHKLISSKIETYMTMDDLQLGAVKPHFKPYKLAKNDLVSFQKKCYTYLERKRNERK